MFQLLAGAATMASASPTSGPPGNGQTVQGNISQSLAVGACAAMAVFYVAILYAPTLLLRLPQAESVESFLLRRFACAAVSSVASIILTLRLLNWQIAKLGDFGSILAVFGIRGDHLCEAVMVSLLLTSLPYAGTIILRLWTSIRFWNRDRKCFVQNIVACLQNIVAWRTYLVAPLTEELVFRACMIPLLLCGGVRTNRIIFLSPIFFSLAHLNHFMELFHRPGFEFSKALYVTGVQLVYTVMFGWYAAFLFIRTGNLLPPVVAHILCNFMGLPLFSSSHLRGLVSLAFAIGSLSFFSLLFPATNPNLYNDTTDGCNCWHGYCHWE